jgi:hypothetical protein
MQRSCDTWDWNGVDVVVYIASPKGLHDHGVQHA